MPQYAQICTINSRFFLVLSNPQVLPKRKATRKYFMDAEEDKIRLVPWKSWWYRVIGVCLFALASTIAIVCSIALLYLLPKISRNFCSCSTNTNDVLARVEILEQKLALLDKSFPGLLDIQTEVNISNFIVFF